MTSLYMVIKEYKRSNYDGEFFNKNVYYFKGQRVIEINIEKRKIVFEDGSFQYFPLDDCHNIYLGGNRE